MPNHVTHQVDITGLTEVLKEFTQAHLCEHAGKYEGSLFSFQTLIPRPVAYDYTVSPSPLKKYFSTDPISQALLEELLTNGASFDVLKRTFPEDVAANSWCAFKYGIGNWYDWSIVRWGTKWNAYNVEFLPTSDEHSIHFVFDTAWSVPSPIFEEIADLYPELTFEIKALDEGYSFAYEITIYEGEVEIAPIAEEEIPRFAKEHFGHLYEDDEED